MLRFRWAVMEETEVRRLVRIRYVFNIQHFIKYASTTNAFSSLERLLFLDIG